MQMTGGNKYGIHFGKGEGGIGFWQIQDDFYLVENYALYTKWMGGNYWHFPIPSRHYNGVKPHFYNANYRTNPTAMYVNFLSGSTGSFPYFVAGGRCPHETNAARVWTGLFGPKKKVDHLYPDYYHHYYGTKGAPQVSIYYNGTNEMSFQWIRNNHPQYTGIVYADFPGKDLIGEIINSNFR
jgi:1-phosphatidylinositol phosphodiesterase